MADEAPIEVVAPDGDLILHVGTPRDGTHAMTIRVSSTALTRTSKVFAALLDGHFKEGQAVRASESPQVVALPDDDEDAMRDMCMLLHVKTPPSYQRGMTIFELYELAMVIDKYGISEELRLQGQALLVEFLDGLPQNKCGTPLITGLYLAHVAAAAYHLNNQKYFEIATQRLIREARFPLFELDPDSEENGDSYDFPKTLPVAVFRAAEHKFLLAQDSIIRQFPEHVTSYCESEYCHCAGPGEVPWEEIKIAFKVDSWPGGRMPIQEAIQCMGRLPGRPREG